MASKVGIIVELNDSSEVYIRKQQEDFTLSDDIGNQILLSKEDWKGVIEHLQTFINGEKGSTHNTTVVINHLPPDQDGIIDVTKLACFEQVESVFGREQAIEELERVVAWNWDAMRFDPKESVSVPLESAFTWDATPQGSLFWISVALGENPYLIE